MRLSKRSHFGEGQRKTAIGEDDFKDLADERRESFGSGGKRRDQIRAQEERSSRWFHPGEMGFDENGVAKRIAAFDKAGAMTSVPLRPGEPILHQDKASARPVTTLKRSRSLRFVPMIDPLPLLFYTVTKPEQFIFPGR